jgi:hypothetical protein
MPELLSLAAYGCGDAKCFRDMQLTSSLTLPDELERARVDGNLVVFAGAGVSMGHPANLPDFLRLAKEITQPTRPLSARDKSALDRYLGRAERKSGILVQERARDILGNALSSHTPVHEYLLGLFESADRVRLITTNFDLHFSGAADQVFGLSRVRRYVGPALPPGRDFRGIVQLHGALDQTDDRLVLTDRDFASAYMAEGWASRFLVGVFDKRTILFVGYGLNDPVMQYLMHALPPTDRWYSLCQEKDGPLFTDFGVVPVTFATPSKSDRYKGLTDGLRRWDWYARATVSDHDTELRRLIALGPPASPIDSDYLRARLNSPAGRDCFSKIATERSWFDWAASNGLLDVLIDERHELSVVVFWVGWALEWFCCGEQPPVLGFLRSRSLQMHRYFADALARHLAIKPLPPRPALRQLIAVLVTQSDWLLNRADNYVWLLTRLAKEGYAAEAVSLLAHLTRVRLEPAARLFRELETIGGQQEQLPSLTNRIGTNAPAGDLIDFLDQHGAAIATVAAEDLAYLGAHRVAQSYELLGLARADEVDRDWLSLARTAIARSDQDGFPEGADVLVLLVRSALDHWQFHDHDRLRDFVARHARSDRALMQRLRVYAFAISPTKQADEILQNAVTERWARVTAVRPEFYLVLKKHFRAASSIAQIGFVDAVCEDSWWGDEFDENQQRVRFSLSKLLVGLDPGSRAAQTFALAESTAHPTWPQLDPDGFDSRLEIRWGGADPSPITPEQMVRWMPEQALATINGELKRPGMGEYERAPLLGAVQEAARADAEWAVALFSGSIEDSGQHGLLQDAICWGLHSVACTPSVQLSLLERLVTWEWPHELTRTLGMLLDKWSRDLHSEAPTPLLDAFDIGADRIYARAGDVDGPDLGERGRTDRAINHPAGNAASVWWNVANARDRASGRFVLTLDGSECGRWERVISDERPGAGHARVILGMALERLANGDFSWAERVVFPAFAPGGGAERAGELWEGRLEQRQWSWKAMSGLAPFLKPFLELSASLVPARSRELGDFIALSVARRADTKFAPTNLRIFVRHATPAARAAFADALPNHMKLIDSDARGKLWNGMLRAYWRDRLTNMPSPFDAAERAALPEWVVALPEVLNETLTLLEKTTGEATPHADRVLMSWRQDDTWLCAHPIAAVRIIRWLVARRSMDLWHVDEAAQHLDSAFTAGAPQIDVLSAAEELGEYGCASALRLAARLREGHPPSPPSS